MAGLSRILVPIDFSERSLGAARYASTLAHRFPCEVNLLHVLAPPHYEFGALEVGGSMLAELYANRNLQVTKDLDQFADEHFRGMAVNRLVLEGDPARQIVAWAHDHHADLIVMPTHGYGPFRRFILGSITAKVLHDADCPVWTGIHLETAPEVEAIRFQTIVCALDLGPQSCSTLEWAGAFQKACGARLVVVHAGTYRPGEDQDWRVRAEERLSAEVERLEHKLETKAEIYLEPGDPPHVVCAAAERMQADLLVIGRGSARGVFGRLRTNAYAIIRQSPCPVVSV